MSNFESGFNVYLVLAKKLALLLPDAKDRVKACKWIKKIVNVKHEDAKEMQNHALQLLLLCLQRKVLVGPFKQFPEKEKPFSSYDWSYQPADIARDILQAEYEEKGQPPITCQLSGDLCEYVADQDIPQFGADTENNKRATLLHKPTQFAKSKQFVDATIIDEVSEKSSVKNVLEEERMKLEDFQRSIGITDEEEKESVQIQGEEIKEDMFQKMPDRLRESLAKKFVPKELQKYPGRDPNVGRTPEIFRKSASGPFRKYKPQEFLLPKDEPFRPAAEVFKGLEYIPPSPTTRRSPIRKGLQKIMSGKKSEATEAPSALEDKDVEMSFERSMAEIRERRKEPAELGQKLKDFSSRRKQLLERLRRVRESQPRKLVFEEGDIDIEPEDVQFERFVYQELPEEEEVTKEVTILRDEDMPIEDVFGDDQISTPHRPPPTPASMGELRTPGILLETEMPTEDVFSEDQVADPKVVFKEVRVEDEYKIGISHFHGEIYPSERIDDESFPGSPASRQVSSLREDTQLPEAVYKPRRDQQMSQMQTEFLDEVPFQRVFTDFQDYHPRERVEGQYFQEFGAEGMLPGEKLEDVSLQEMEYRNREETADKLTRLKNRLKALKGLSMRTPDEKIASLQQGDLLDPIKFNLSPEEFRRGLLDESLPSHLQTPLIQPPKQPDYFASFERKFEETVREPGKDSILAPEEMDELFDENSVAQYFPPWRFSPPPHRSPPSRKEVLNMERETRDESIKSIIPEAEMEDMFDDEAMVAEYIPNWPRSPIATAKRVFTRTVERISSPALASTPKRFEGIGAFPRMPTDRILPSEDLERVSFPQYTEPSSVYATPSMLAERDVSDTFTPQQTVHPLQLPRLRTTPVSLPFEHRMALEDLERVSSPRRVRESQQRKLMFEEGDIDIEPEDVQFERFVYQELPEEEEVTKEVTILRDEDMPIEDVFGDDQISTPHRPPPTPASMGKLRTPGILLETEMPTEDMFSEDQVADPKVVFKEVRVEDEYKIRISHFHGEIYPSERIDDESFPGSPASRQVSSLREDTQLPEAVYKPRRDQQMSQMQTEFLDEVQFRRVFSDFQDYHPRERVEGQYFQEFGAEGMLPGEKLEDVSLPEMEYRNREETADKLTRLKNRLKALKGLSMRTPDEKISSLQQGDLLDPIKFNLSPEEFRRGLLDESLPSHLQTPLIQPPKQADYFASFERKFEETVREPGKDSILASEEMDELFDENSVAQYFPPWRFSPPPHRSPPSRKEVLNMERETRDESIKSIIPEAEMEDMFDDEAMVAEYIPNWPRSPIATAKRVFTRTVERIIGSTLKRFEGIGEFPRMPTGPFRKYKPQEFLLPKDEPFRPAAEVFKGLENIPPSPTTRRSPIRKGLQKIMSGKKSETTEAPSALEDKDVEMSFERSMAEIRERRKEPAELGQKLKDFSSRRKQLLERLRRVRESQPRKLVFEEGDIDIEPEDVQFERFVYQELPEEEEVTKEVTILRDEDMPIEDVFGDDQISTPHRPPPTPASMGELRTPGILLETEMPTEDVFSEDQVADPKVVFKEVRVEDEYKIGISHFHGEIYPSERIDDESFPGSPASRQVSSLREDTQLPEAVYKPRRNQQMSQMQTEFLDEVPFERVFTDFQDYHPRERVEGQYFQEFGAEGMLPGEKLEDVSLQEMEYRNREETADKLTRLKNRLKALKGLSMRTPDEKIASLQQGDLLDPIKFNLSPEEFRRGLLDESLPSHLQTPLIQPPKQPDYFASFERKFEETVREPGKDSILAPEEMDELFDENSVAQYFPPWRFSPPPHRSPPSRKEVLNMERETRDESIKSIIPEAEMEDMFDDEAMVAEYIPNWPRSPIATAKRVFTRTVERISSPALASTPKRFEGIGAFPRMPTDRILPSEDLERVSFPQYTEPSSVYATPSMLAERDVSDTFTPQQTVHPLQLPRLRTTPVSLPFEHRMALEDLERVSSPRRVRESQQRKLMFEEGDIDIEPEDVQFERFVYQELPEEEEVTKEVTILRDEDMPIEDVFGDDQISTPHRPPPTPASMGELRTPGILLETEMPTEDMFSEDQVADPKVVFKEVGVEDEYKIRISHFHGEIYPSERIDDESFPGSPASRQVSSLREDTQLPEAVYKPRRDQQMSQMQTEFLDEVQFRRVFSDFQDYHPRERVEGQYFQEFGAEGMLPGEKLEDVSLPEMEYRNREETADNLTRLKNRLTALKGLSMRTPDEKISSLQQDDLLDPIECNLSPEGFRRGLLDESLPSHLQTPLIQPPKQPDYFASFERKFEETVREPGKDSILAPEEMDELFDENSVAQYFPPWRSSPPPHRSPPSRKEVLNMERETRDESIKSIIPEAEMEDMFDDEAMVAEYIPNWPRSPIATAKSDEEEAEFERYRLAHTKESPFFIPTPPKRPPFLPDASPIGRTDVLPHEEGFKWLDNYMPFDGQVRPKGKSRQTNPVTTRRTYRPFERKDIMPDHRSQKVPKPTKSRFRVTRADENATPVTTRSEIDIAKTTAPLSKVIELRSKLSQRLAPKEHTETGQAEVTSQKPFIRRRSISQHVSAYRPGQIRITKVKSSVEAGGMPARKYTKEDISVKRKEGQVSRTRSAVSVRRGMR